MVHVEARVVDATHLELASPISGPPGRKVIVSLAEPDVRDAEDAAWRTVSSRGLAAAYGDAEPEYPPAMLREPNPEYQA